MLFFQPGSIIPTIWPCLPCLHCLAVVLAYTVTLMEVELSGFFSFFLFSLSVFFSSHFPNVAFRKEAENIEQTADVPKIQMCEKDS